MFSFIAIGLGLAGIVCYILIWVILGVGMVAGTANSNF